MRVRLSRRARRDLEKIFAYVARDSPAAAASIIAQIEAFSTLTTFPEAGRAAGIGDLRVIGVRRLPYLIYYRQADSELQIVTVRHAKRRRL